MLLFNKTIKSKIQSKKRANSAFYWQRKLLIARPKLLKLFVSTSLLCWLDLLIFPSLSQSQDRIKLPRENRPTTEEVPASETEQPQNPTFNLDNSPPTPQPIPTFNPVTSPQLSTYRLDSGDGLSINVTLHPEFNTVGTLDSEGNLIVPIVGRISLVGLTIREVESKIAYELGTRFLKEAPEVIATLTLTRPAQVNILGEVVRPGFYGFLAGSPITEILQGAGGSTKDADLRSIIVRRNLRDGTILEQKVDLYSALVDGKQLPPVFLQGGDTIIVSQLEPGEAKNYDRQLVSQSTLPQQAINVRVVFPADTGTSLRNLVLPNGSTFIDAVASLPSGDPLLLKQEIALFRFDPDTGNVVTQSLDTREVLQPNSTQNVLLQDEDVIVVGRSLLGKVFNGFDVLTRPIRSFFGFTRFFDNIFR
jgi:polysaccharide biosynthesis/export protein